MLSANVRPDGCLLSNLNCNPMKQKAFIKHSRLTFAVVCLALYGCGTKDSGQSGANADFEMSYPYTVSIDIDKAVPMENVLDHQKYISFTEDVENIMGFARNMVVRGDTIFAIASRPSPGIFAYLKSGEQLFAYCSEGSGPRDINSPSCISVTGDEVSTYDDASYKTVIIGKDGKYRRNIAAPIMALNAIVDSKGNHWTDFTNQNYDTVRVSCKFHGDTAYRTVMNVPELQKGMTQIEIEALQNLPDGTVGYTPSYEPRIYSLSDDGVAVRYELDFNGLWPDDETFKVKFTGNDWAPKTNRFPVQNLRFHESERYLVIGFKHKKQPYLHILDRTTGNGVTMLLDQDNYYCSSYVTDSELYLGRKDDRMEIMKIKEIE